MALVLYLIFANIVSFALMGLDKHLAGTGQGRIPEKSLFLAAAAGGSYGALAGMYHFRHKTRKPGFAIGIPLLAALETALLLVSLILR